ncbi:MAG: DUF1015 domain-containing protein [Alphaproteobacteria bacterium]|tara:strand:+ start:2514 stop:3755 length:1242 start_codon:yes stop_codon:yes gene_type:complete
MKLIKSFKALRPKKGKENDVIAPPYDVLNSAEAREMAKNKPFSFLHVSKPEIDLDHKIEFSNPKVYEKGAENLNNLIKNKVLIQDDEDCLYIYEIKLNEISQTGVGCIASVEAYQKNIIKKHEYTKPEKEDDRVENITKLKAQTGPVLLAYKNTDKISEAINKAKVQKPVYNVFAHDGSNHKIWVVNNKDQIEKMLSEINSMESLFIADGHHRSAAAARVKEKFSKKNLNHDGNENYNYFLAVAFPHSEMTILDYNRIIKGLNGQSINSLISNIEKNYFVKKHSEEFKPVTKNTFGMYIDKNWYELNAIKENINLTDPVKSLDVSILHDTIIEPLLGIYDERTDPRIDFVGGARGLKELENRVNNDNFDIAFALFPTPIEALIDVAEANKVMPPKSTWFEPKLLDGLLSHLIN